MENNSYNINKSDNNKNGSKIPSLLLTILIILTISSVSIYLIVRTSLFFTSDYQFYEKIIASFMLLCETFIIIHSIGYFLNVFHSLRDKKTKTIINTDADDLDFFPPVAIIVSSYKEPLNVIDDTLTCFYNLTYPNKHLYFLDDTRYDLPDSDINAMSAYRKSIDDLCKRIGINLFRRKWRGAKAGMINDFLEFIENGQREGFEFQKNDDQEKHEKEKYIIVFDADQNPIPNFVEPLVSIMERNPRLAFVQTPQYYTNFEKNRVARAAGLQQIIFYEYICEGKSTQDAMFCCGTNVVFRREALMDVGGQDETSVTEDFATSLKFHTKGWNSIYLNKVCAFGMGPEDLAGYFKQQFRWALGTVGLFRKIAIEFVRHPSKLSFAKWWEYFLSGTHYFVGWVFFIMMLCPNLFIFFKVPTFFARPDIYFLFFTPYIIISLSVFFWTLQKRNYKFRDLFSGVLLGAICFPIYMSASAIGILGLKRGFGITPKGGAKSLPLTELSVQLVAAIICFASVIWGINRIYYERAQSDAIMLNSFWCLYHFLILSTIIYYNNPETSD